MVDPTLPLPDLSPVSGKPVVARFDGGVLSSDCGLLMLREVEQRLGLADRLASCIKDPRDPDLITHSLADIIRFRLLMIAAGYEDGNDATSLRLDPMFKMALDHLPSDADLCSQPTISRLENLLDTRTLLRIGRMLIDLYCGSFRQVPKRIILDWDDTFDAVRGAQQLRLFNAHHDEYGFQPIVVFDGEGRFVTAILRPAQRPKGTEIRAHLRRVMRHSRFIVTSLTKGSPRDLYQKAYCDRGQAENHIKSWKTHLAADRTSCTKATANQFRPFLHAGAYWMMWSLRCS